VGIDRFIARVMREASPGQLVPLFLALLLGLAFSLGEPFIWLINIQQAIDSAVGITQGNAPRGPAFAITIALSVFGFVLLAVLQWLGNLAASARATRMAAEIADRLRLRLFDHLQSLSLGFFDRARTGDVVNRLTADVDAVESAMARWLPQAASQVMLLVLAVVLMALLDWRFALTEALIGLVLLLVWRRVSPGAEALGRARQQGAAEVAATVEESVAAQSVVKAFGLADTLGARFRDQVDAMTRGARTVGFFGGVTGTFAIVAFLALFAGIMLLSVGLFVAGALPRGAGPLYITIGLLLRPVVGALQGLIGLVAPLEEAAAAMDRVDELLAERPTVVDVPGAQPMPRPEHEIRLHDASLAYDGARQALRGVSMVIPAGQLVALVGASGAGKSSLLAILARLRDPTGGSVEVDGHDLRRFTQASLREHIAVVFQESFLFDATLRENIRIGRPRATDAEVEEAARAAEIHEFVAGLPQGYDTPTGERGVRLSSGQRQRIAIARALVRDPAVLLLDEPTAALDPSTESAVIAALRRLAVGRTVVISSHRLSAIAEADRIFVLEDGRLEEEGSHDYLLAKRGAYHQLWQRQSGLTLEDGPRARVDAERLGSVPVLADLDAPLLERAARLFVTDQVAEGREVIHEGDPGDTFYILVRGALAVIRGGERLRILRDGDHFGEIALLRNVPRTATVRTIIPSVLLSLQRGQFEELIAEAPALRERLLRTYAEATE
jgi:ATP-binding cassette subfamily B protein